ncbi:flagellar hook-basal body complex protein FliE [Bacillus solimangrovi]|uniref:Flagellar hook-basal body complex protein FliE n=1 Tax=Bacillus solimangrovi TaxID=1305675 RepID=A0A1E5LAY5_9BACI|nr:flagellar hook-basal body complex protein FliE [Bacillus solimangrovi]OEH91257.1 flagellar hook-basal body complex protein FliE [Bacillus solimangrovi]
MKTTNFQPVTHILKPQQNQMKKITPAEAQSQFSTAFKQALDNVNETQIKSDEMTTKFIKGEITDLHTVMIASQKASVTRTLTVEVRDKVIEAYREIMRMQV